MNALEAISLVEKSLRQAAFESYKVEARFIVEHVLDKAYYQIVLEPKPLGQLEEQKLNAILKRRLNNEPLQYILAETEFYGIKLKLNKNVLIPRVETESLVELVIKTKANKILDIATGSGAISIAIKTNLPDSTVVASDISLPALELAQVNAKNNNLEINFIHADLLKNVELLEFAKSADIIIANLPYLPKSDIKDYKLLTFEPALALFSGVDGLYLFRSLEKQAFKVLKPKAMLICELDPRNIDLAFELSKDWSKREIIKDILAKKRFLKLIR